ncbi:MAG: UvrD-helicase domain-containing protein [Phycisphaerales bacterium]|nr:UvrD-helicase domain-containing protein [Phycisphaerales bacterium]
MSPGSQPATGKVDATVHPVTPSNLCVTGDPDQSIYGWRGASIRNILEFEKQYPQAAIVRLEQNYRSTQAILAVADQLIQNNQQRKHKRLWTDNQQGDKVMTVTCMNEQHEAQWVVEHFEKLRQEHKLTFGDQAIFYRMNSLSRVIEDALRKAGIPYQIARGTAFFDRKEVKDALGYLRVLANPADEVNLLRIINTPARGLSDATVKLLQARAVAGGVPILGVIKSPPQWAGLNSKAQGAVERFGKFIDRLRQLAGLAEVASEVQAENLPMASPDEHPSTHEHELTLRDFVDRVLTESGLHEFYAKDKTDPDQERLANLGELVTSAQQFEKEYETEHRDEPDRLTLARKLLAYLEQVSLVSDLDAVEAGRGCGRH